MKEVYDKTAIRFGFWDNWKSKSLSKCYQSQPSATVENTNETKTALVETLITPNITHSEFNNSLLFCF